jgi:hypothetical protein
VYIGIQFCEISKISKIPSDPYEAVLPNLGAHKFNFVSHPETQNNKAITKKPQPCMHQNGPSDSSQFTHGCDYNNHPSL